MPECPRCGGDSALALGPGYYRCMNRVPRWSDDDPGEHVTCGFEFQEGYGLRGNVPLCDCGTLAVGRCMECGAWRCGIHSGVLHGRRLCADHYRGVERRLEQQQAADRKAELGAFQTWRRNVLNAEPERILDTFVHVMRRVGCPGARQLEYVYKSKTTYPRLRHVERSQSYPHKAWYLGHLADKDYIPVHLDTEGSVVVLTVKDTGAGMGKPMVRKPVIYRGRRRAAVLRDQLHGGLAGNEARVGHDGAYRWLARYLKGHETGWPAGLPSLIPPEGPHRPGALF